MWNSNMANFVLVHGSAHGSWCWERVVPLLKEKGHRVVAVDLPGNGNDDTPLSEVTLETYARHVCAVLDSLDSPAVVVGHSLGGLTISRTAELRPGGVAVLVYLTALLLEDGESFAPAVSADPEEVAAPGAIMNALETRTSWNISDDLSHVVYKPELAQHRFYNDCSDDDVEWAKSMLVPQPVGPLVSPVRITDANYGQVPRVYLKCALDNAVTPEHAQRIYTALPCAQVITMQTGHSPFLSDPVGLAGHLDGLARYATSSRPR